MITFYGVLWLNSGNDLIATHFHSSINTITWVCRVLIVVGPVLAFWITRRVAIALQRADLERLLHGRESGIIVRSVDGAYTEKDLPISVYESYVLTARDRLRAALSRFYFADAVQTPARAELGASDPEAERPAGRTISGR